MGTSKLRGPNRQKGAPPPGAVNVTRAAKLLRSSNPTLWRWIEEGAPFWFSKGLVHRKDKGYRVDPDDLRAWRARRERGREAQAAELTDEGRAKLEEVISRIRSATRYEELGEVARDVGALVLSGQISSGAGQTATAALREARQALKAHRETDTGEADLALRPVHADAVELVRAYQGIVDDKRRARLLRSVKRAASKDLAEHPLPDTTQGAA